jgi:hypothetical protein
MQDISWRELVPLGDVVCNDHNRVAHNINNHIPPNLAHFIPNCQNFFILLKLDATKEYNGLNYERLCG